VSQYALAAATGRNTYQYYECFSVVSPEVFGVAGIIPTKILLMDYP
jgi:hypothetical protein